MALNDDTRLEQRFGRGTTPAERRSAEFNASPELAADIDTGKRIRAGFAHGEAARLRTILQEEEKAISRQGGFKIWIRGAMAAAAVLVPLVFFLWPSSDPFVAYENRLSAMGAADDTERQIQAASKAYDDKDYAKAAELFGALAAASPTETKFSFYQGVSLMAKKQYALALPIWQGVISSQQQPYASEGHWYLALTQRALGNNAAARAHLLDYQKQPAGIFKKDVEGVLKTLK
jgi:TolA-binding protein